MKRMLPGWHMLTVRDGTMRYRGRTYDLSGAQATMENTGWRGQKHAVVIDGRDFQVRLPVIKQRLTASHITQAVNNEALARRAATR